MTFNPYETRCPQPDDWQDAPDGSTFDPAANFNPDDYIFIPINWRRAKRFKNRLVKINRRIHKKFGPRAKEHLITKARQIQNTPMVAKLLTECIGAQGFEIIGTIETVILPPLSKVDVAAAEAINEFYRGQSCT